MTKSVPDLRIALSVVLCLAASVASAQRSLTVPTPLTGACTASDPVVLGTTSDRRPPSVGIAIGSRGGLAAWSLAADRARVQPLDPSGASRGAAVDVEIGHAHGLTLLAPLERGVLAMTRGDLCPGSHGQSCFHARAIGYDGRPLGAALDEPPHDQWATLETFTILRDEVYAAQIWRYGGRIARYSIAGGTPQVASAIDGTSECSGGAGISFVANDGARLVALAAFEPDCNPERRLFVLPEGREVRVVGLPMTAEVLAIELAGDTVLVVFRVGRGHPRVATFGLDGRLRGRPTAIRPTDPLPAPMASQSRVTLAEDGPMLSLERTDLAGRPRGPRIELGRGTLSGRARMIAWTGSELAAIYVTGRAGSWEVSTRRVRCQ